MKKLTHSFPAKIIAIFLLIIMVSLSIGSAVGIALMYDEDFYVLNDKSFYDSRFCEDITIKYADSVFYNYFNLSQKENPSEQLLYQLDQYKKEFSEENTNLFFSITDDKGKELLVNYLAQDYGMQRTYIFYMDINKVSSTIKVVSIETYYVTCYVKNPITVKDNYYTPYQLYNFAYSMRYNIIVIMAAAIILAFILFIFLLYSAGHRKNKEEITRNGIDKIPFDLFIASEFFITMFLFNIYEYNLRWSLHDIKYFLPFIFIIFILILSLCMTFATRFKLGKWWENTIIFRVLKLCFIICTYIFKGIRQLSGNLPLLWKTILIFIGISFIELIYIFLFIDKQTYDRHVVGLIFIFWMLFHMILLAVLCFTVIFLNKLKKGGEKIAEGDLNYKIDTTRMFWDFKRHGENLNNISIGMSKAVEEKIKSERFKTELITNVSHDLKTPLTSIINYVDLLKKEKIENENALNYIEVLDRQSVRLKKLTEDLVEASKAATGNISVNTERTDLSELINQAFGEYAERFKANELEAIITVPQTEVYITTDGRLLWRVFDNLLNNICKYSLSNTRVYLNITDTENKIMLTFKNISKYPLNITPEELLDRFVRGDSSRTTEGSGLGLSIAKSLVELLKGCFELFVDGDLFKIILSFDKID